MSDREGNIRPNLKIHRIYWHTIKDRRVFTPDNPFIASIGEPEVGKRLMIEYSPGTDSHLVRIPAWYNDLLPETDEQVGTSRLKDPHSVVGAMKRVTWDVMERAFNDFLTGQETPVRGTAIGSWPALDMQRAEIFRAFGLATLEEILEAPESKIIAIAPRMPDVRHYVDLAAKFLEAKKVTAGQAALAVKDNEIDLLRGEVDELKDMLRQVLEAKIKEQAEDEPEPVKRRGRRSNAEIEAERAARAEAELDVEAAA